MTALDKVEAALSSHGYRKQAGNWNCPAHEDNQPSLHLTSDARGVGFKCHAGCEPKDILHALNLDWTDVFEEAMKEVARYPYYSGGELYEKVRLANGHAKTFRWEPALNGHKLSLYRLKEAFELPDPLYLIESEKDVDTLLDMGVSATCMPGGAGSWTQEYTDALRGVEVIIIADRDDAGVKHAMKVSSELKDARIVQSRTEGDHDDVGDHLAAGWQLEDLVPFSSDNEITKRYVRIDWRAAFSQQPEDVRWLKPDFLEKGTLNCMFSKPGVGKSLISLEIALEVVRAGGRVVYIDDENRRDDIVDRLRAFRVNPSELNGLIVYNFQNLPPLDSEEGGQHLSALAQRDQPDLLIMDTVSRMVKGAENDADTYLQLYRCSLTKMKARDITVLRLDHTGKDSARGQRGSSAKESDADTLWYLTRDSDTLYTLECQKSRSGHVPYGTIVNLTRKYEPLRHIWDVKITIPMDRYAVLMRWMDEQGIPTSLGRDKVRKALADNGMTGMRNDQLQAAIIERRNRERRGFVPSSLAVPE